MRADLEFVWSSLEEAAAPLRARWVIPDIVIPYFCLSNDRNNLSLAVKMFHHFAIFVIVQFWCRGIIIQCKSHNLSIPKSLWAISFFVHTHENRCLYCFASFVATYIGIVVPRYSKSGTEITMWKEDWMKRGTLYSTIIICVACDNRKWRHRSRRHTHSGDGERLAYEWLWTEWHSLFVLCSYKRPLLNLCRHQNEIK